MNGYDAQDMATQGAEGFRSGYQAGYADAVKAVEAGKPAAAQETAASRESEMVVIRRGEDGRPAVWCDPEIADLVSALNVTGIATVASCSGHGHRPGTIALADGRELLVMPNREAARKIDHLWPGINGEMPAAAPVDDSYESKIVNGNTEHERIESLAKWLESCSFRADILSIAAATLRDLLQKAESAPAAPGIDLGKLPSREVVDFWHRFGYRDEAKALLALIEQSDASPNGGSGADTYALPALATSKMLDAGWPRGEVIDDTFDKQGAYADLLAAALQATSAEVGS